MTSLSKLTLLAALLGSASAHAANSPVTNLATNGSFETGSFSGWTAVLGDATTFVDGSSTTGTQFDQATDGHWYALFGSTAADGGASISQQLATAANTLYTLSFDLANSNGGGAPANAFSVSVGGRTLLGFQQLAEQGYVHYSATFAATGTSTLLALAGFNDASYVELDNVVVTAAVPEPSTVAMTLVGLVALGARVTRRRREG